jgi:hypothetical protein
MKNCMFSFLTVQLVSFQSVPKKDFVSLKIKEYFKSCTIIQLLVCVKMTNYRN